jgi:hypothetical protein
MEKQLLATFLDLYTYESKIKNWSLESFKANPPRFYRLKMITSIMQALDISCSYIDFSYGDFIDEIHYKNWQQFKESILKDIESPKQKKINRIIDNSDINTIFYSLMNYRLYAQKLLSSNDGIYVASEEFKLFSELMNRPNRLLIKELEKIDKVLLFCINPSGLNYSKDELIAQFNYPDVDLNEIDIEWM